MKEIPKVIHYCWFGGNPLTEEAKKCIDSWKRYCPNYDIKEWNESNFDITLCNYVKEAYEAKKWAFVSDYARLWILYNYGGLYFDTDVEMIKGIEDLVKNGPFMGAEPYSSKACRVNAGLGLASYSEHPLYKVYMPAPEPHLHGVSTARCRRRTALYFIRYSTWCSSSPFAFIPQST